MRPDFRGPPVLLVALDLSIHPLFHHSTTNWEQAMLRLARHLRDHSLDCWVVVVQAGYRRCTGTQTHWGRGVRGGAAAPMCRSCKCVVVCLSVVLGGAPCATLIKACPNACAGLAAEHWHLCVHSIGAGGRMHAQSICSHGVPTRGFCGVDIHGVMSCACGETAASILRDLRLGCLEHIFSLHI